uniref:Small nuclear ribonucleoprotein E n=1 Tax=Lynx canadensis TaxID=61383 RepID=A0A667H682_LYNCA
MAYRGQGQKVQKVMVQPINLIFRYLQNRSRIQVWLYEQVNMRIEGCIIGFDEYMNLVLDDAEEIHSKTKSRKQLAGGTVFLCVVYYTNRNKFGEQGKLGVWGTVTLCHLSESPESRLLRDFLPRPWGQAVWLDDSTSPALVPPGIGAILWFVIEFHWETVLWVAAFVEDA